MATGNAVTVLAVPVTIEIIHVLISHSYHCGYLGISLQLSLLQSYGSYQTYSQILLFNTVKKSSFALSQILTVTVTILA